MLETKRAFEAEGHASPRQSLARFQFHTGAPLRSLGEDEVCPVLFRDVGPEAMARYLSGGLGRLAGPLSPIIYMRTERYVEPYTDHGRFGRLVVYRPWALGPWFSGVEHIYVADARQPTPWGVVGFVPYDVPLERARDLGAEVRRREEWREALGGRALDGAMQAARERISSLLVEQAQADAVGAPLRGCLKSRERAVSEQARALMERAGVSEGDLCAAWHHLPDARRAALVELLGGLAEPVAKLAAGGRGYG